MRNFLIALGVFVSSMACQSQAPANTTTANANTQKADNTYQITGKVKNSINGKVYLERMNDRNIPLRLDSTTFSPEMTFSFKGTIAEPGIYQVNIANQQVIGLILDGGEKLNIIADGISTPEKAGSYNVEGSPMMAKLNQIMLQSQQFRQVQTNLQSQFDAATQKKDDKKIKEIQGIYQTEENNYYSTIKPMIGEMGTSMAALIATNNFLNPEKDLEFFTALSEKLEKEGKNHFFAKLFIQDVKRKSSGAVGSEASDFSLVNLEGKKVTLSELKGKVVVLDFWATWCGPCIMSFPGMRQAMEKYKSNPNVEFLFVNTYERVDENSWLNTVSSFAKQRGFNNLPIIVDVGGNIATNYGVNGIPAKFCIGKDGKIKFKSTGYLGSNEAIVKEMTHWIDEASK